jgi:hypothetical protein
MNITDKQVEAALKQLPFDYPTTLQPYVVKQMIEAAMQAAWVKFDHDDETTHPRISHVQTLSNRYILRIVSGDESLILSRMCYFIDGKLLFGSESDLCAFKGLVTHWMPMPCFKELA